MGKDFVFFLVENRPMASLRTQTYFRRRKMTQKPEIRLCSQATLWPQSRPQSLRCPCPAERATFAFLVLTKRKAVSGDEIAMACPSQIVDFNIRDLEEYSKQGHDLSSKTCVFNTYSTFSSLVILYRCYSSYSSHRSLNKRHFGSDFAVLIVVNNFQMFDYSSDSAAA